MTGLPLLSIAIWLPAVGALLLLFVSNRDNARDALIRNLTLTVSLLTATTSTVSVISPSCMAKFAVRRPSAFSSNPVRCAFRNPCSSAATV